MCKIMKNVILILVLVWLSLPGYSNNVRLNGTVKVTDVTSGVATLELDLAWDNSWRDNFNWDAVWIFLKYKPASGAWSHVMLQETGNEATPGYQVMNGKSGNNVVGVYVFLGKNDTRRQASTTVTLKWACGSAYTKASFDNNQVFLLAQGIEMVYVPFGAYYLGDGSSANTFGGADGKPFAVSGEGAIATLYQRASDGTVNVAVSNLNANYPKGYGGFYVMKYETSQEQYVTFLNTLTRAEQETLLGASFLSALSPGRYIFGDTLQPTFRNGIVLSGKSSGQPYIFDNNLNGNDVYGEDGDGQCVACNYMSLNDLLAYASWSGLRPMSELEYERACRAPFPQDPLAGEYPWNSNGGVSRVTGLSAGGRETEVASTTSCNVNSGGGLTGSNQGPVRCGLFARSTSSQTVSGATYWGVMEMAGNVRELVAGVSHTSLSRTTNGGGTFSTSAWGSATPGFFGLRGGGFSGADSLLRTSGRSEMNKVASVADRDETVGFRLTRTLDAGSVTVNPGTISLSSPLCPGIESTVSETAAASISGMTGNFPLSYTWSYSINNGSTWTVISGETANTLKYSAFEAGKTYLFRRTAVCALGEASTQTTGIAASAPTVITAQPTDVVNAPCNLSISVTATGTSLSYQWEKDGAVISNAKSATYAKNPTEASDAGKYVCRVTGACGVVPSKEIIVIVGGYEDGVLTDSRDGQTYRTRIMPDGHVWMIEDLRFGTCNTSAFTTYCGKSIQNQIAAGYYGVCIASKVAGGGNLYNWQAAMNHPNAVYNTSGNPSGNVNGNSPNQWQGICPDGWHLPSGGSTGEFLQLYTSLCSNGTKIYPGTGAFEGILSGLGYGGEAHDDGRVYYWSSTYYDGANASSMAYSSGLYPQNKNAKDFGFVVRCVKNY